MSPPALNPQALNPEVATIVKTYESLRDVMPPFPKLPRASKPKSVPRLRDIAFQFDALFLDGFGVLNIGDTLIPGAKELIAMTQARPLPVLVVTNAASQSVASIGRRYLDKGLPIPPPQVIASRHALTHYLIHHRPLAWQTIAIADEDATPLDLAATPLTQHPLTPDNAGTADFDAIAILGTKRWDSAWDETLRLAVTKTNPEILIANPDVAAPYADGFTREPGTIAHTLRQTHPHASIRWFGKPHKPHFDLALGRLDGLLAETGQPPINDRKRIAMVGDSLHTDILGGAAAGLTTILVTDHGLFRDGGADQAIAMTGITPDYITPTI